MTDLGIIVSRPLADMFDVHIARLGLPWPSPNHAMETGYDWLQGF